MEWRHLQIADDRYFVDGVLSTKAKYEELLEKAETTRPGHSGTSWVHVSTST